jgi:hypothetical protein
MIIEILAILVLFHLVSCKNIESTDVETNAVQRVLNFYGGECLKSKGVNSKNGINKTFFELEMSKSELLNLKTEKINTHSANIAYLFLSNLGEEKKNYDEIRVKINLSNGSKQEFSYPKKELLEIQKLKPYLNEIDKLIINNDYSGLLSHFDKTINIDSKAIAELFNTLQNQYGKISRVQFQGFEFKETNNFGNVIIINQALVLEKIVLSMNLILKRDSNEIISIEYE